MLKLRIIMDKEKIARDGRYEASAILSAIDAAFERSGLLKSEREANMYVGMGYADDYAKFWRIIWSLAEKPWFMENVKEWLWFNSDDGKDENDFSIEDIMAFCKENHVGASA